MITTTIVEIQTKQGLKNHLQSVLLQLQDQQPKSNASSVVGAEDLAQDNEEDYFGIEGINPF